jgi:hypothetical protein
MAERLSVAVLSTVLLPYLWKEVGKWQRGEVGIPSWPPTRGRARLVRAGLIVFILLEWLGVVLAAMD